jgi:hypothetical protein
LVESHRRDNYTTDEKRPAHISRLVFSAAAGYRSTDESSQFQHKETKMKTINRGWLRRMVAADRIVAVDAYHFDDMTGESRGLPGVLPVKLWADFPDWHDRKEGTIYLHDHDFKSKSGMAYDGGNGVIHLSVHSNCSYELRLLPVAEMVS